MNSFLAGTTLSICGCCTICAKDVGESCGGLWGIQGKCGNNLVCKKPFNYENADDEEDHYSIGVCIKKGDYFVISVNFFRFFLVKKYPS